MELPERRRATFTRTIQLKAGRLAAILRTTIMDLYNNCLRCNVGLPRRMPKAAIVRVVRQLRLLRQSRSRLQSLPLVLRTIDLLTLTRLSLKEA